MPAKKLKPVPTPKKKRVSVKEQNEFTNKDWAAAAAAADELAKASVEGSDDLHDWLQTNKDVFPKPMSISEADSTAAEDFIRMHAEIHVNGLMDFIFGAKWSEDPSLVDTPKRFVAYLEEFSKPYDPKELLGEGFSNGDSPHKDTVNGMVTQTNIPFRMVCEHHLLPALGTAHIGYIPHHKVAGLSKLTRLVQAVGTKRPSLQELICEEVANVLHDTLDAKGTIVVIQAEHTCMACRGVNVQKVPTITSCVRGIMRDVAQARTEFFSLINLVK
jgi:GTP cyclohydrolase I